MTPSDTVETMTATSGADDRIVGLLRDALNSNALPGELDGFVGAEQDEAAAFVAARPGHWLVDLFAIARMRLADAGLDPARVHGGGLCTISDPQRFFSHRRDQRGGRMATLAWIGA